MLTVQLLYQTLLHVHCAGEGIYTLIGTAIRYMQGKSITSSWMYPRIQPNLCGRDGSTQDERHVEHVCRGGAVEKSVLVSFFAAPFFPS